ncbi:outer membrane beta-barrel family protein [Spirosoma horti]
MPKIHHLPLTTMILRFVFRPLLLLLIALVGRLATGQTLPAPLSLKGHVIDSLTNSPMPFATVALRGGESERMLVTQEDGTFSFLALKPATYQVQVSSLGYQAVVKQVQLTDASVELDPFRLVSQSKQLAEVTVNGMRPLIERQADRISYNLKADPDSKSSSVLTMLRKVPYLSLDGADNILLKGSTSFRVLINGKPSPSLENNLKAVLQSIPASTIERIEVLTMPPAKYDAEGLTGIINIITAKRTREGYNGTINGQGSFPNGGPGAGTSFTMKSGKFGLSANAGANWLFNPTTQEASDRFSRGDSPTWLQQQGTQSARNRTAYGSAELSYQLDSLDLLTAQLNYNNSWMTNRMTQQSTLTGTAGLLQYYDLRSERQSNGSGLDAGLNYERGFRAHKNRLLTLSYLFSTNQTEQLGNVLFGKQVNVNTADYQQEDQQHFGEHTLQVDYRTSLKKIVTELGVKSIFRTNRSDYDYRSFQETGHQFVSVPALANQYTNTQTVLSAYNSYQLTTQRWQVNAGVRLERTLMRASFLTSATVADQDYLNVVPSVSISRAMPHEGSLTAGFSQRIRRPGINRLNPYVDRSNPNYEVTGNPGLRPVVLNDIQLSYGFSNKLSVNVMADYGFMNNLDLQVVYFNPQTQINQVSYANTGYSSNLGLNLNLGYSVGIYRASLNGNGMYLWLAGEVDGQPVTNNMLMYSATLSNVVRLKHGWALNADLSLNSASPTGLQGRTNGFFYSAFNFNKELLKDKLSLSGGIKNPFTTYRTQINTTDGPLFSQRYQHQLYFRSFSLSLTYNFGGLRDRINKSRVGIDNSDLAK